MSVKPLGKREEAKNRNKDRIIAAARQLMQAPGGTLSMRELADMAGVSVATPYNLFGSKQEVIVAVLDDDVQALQQSVSDVGGDPIDGFFGVIDVSVGMLASAPAFYRTGARAVQTDMMDGDLQRHLREPRHTVLRQLVQRAVQQGFISHKISVDIFAVQLGQTLNILTYSPRYSPGPQRTGGPGCFRIDQSPWVPAWPDGLARSLKAPPVTRYTVQSSMGSPPSPW